MECYNCGAPLTPDSRCRQCGADVRVYRKILSASNGLYNLGLEQANVRNLSGAIESLKKSLQLNKMNIDARNLLGLLYFEMGETVAALSEWVISKNYQGRNNLAGQYLNEIQNNPARLDTINQTIKKYNQALIYCRQDSKDLAIIQLKKVLSLNPKLVKGHQLLALLYMEEGKYDLANKALRQAAKIDENNTTTLRYQKEIRGKLKESGSKKHKKDDLISYQSGNDTVIMPAQFKDNSAWQTIVNIVIGVALGIAITMFLLLPNMRQQSKTEENEGIKAANETISKKDQEISALESQVSDLTNQVKEAQDASKAVESKFSSYEALIGAYAAYMAEDMDAAGEALGRVKAEDIGANITAAFSDVSAKVNEKYLAVMYQEGYQAYSKGDYATAAEKLTKVVERDEEYQNGNAVYYLAQSHRRSDNMKDALIYYRKVLEKYPGTERARVAQSYVNANDDGQGQDQQQGQQGQQQGSDQQQGQQGQQQGFDQQQGQADQQQGQPDQQEGQADQQPQEGQPEVSDQ